MKAKFSILCECYIFGEAAGEFQNWPLLGVKGLIQTFCRGLGLQQSPVVFALRIHSVVLSAVQPLNKKHSYSGSGYQNIAAKG